MKPRSDIALPFGFRIVGSCRNDRRPINWLSAFLAYCDCDDRAEVESESYLSAFCFGDDFIEWMQRTGSPKDFAGRCWSDWLWFDIDRDEELDTATTEAGRLAATLVERYQLTGDELLIFFSGDKGFHIGLPLSVCGSLEPSTEFHSCCRRLAEQVAAFAGVAIDSGVYDRIRPFRAPNSCHPKAGRYKRFLTLDELFMLSAPRIVELAADPIAFNIPAPPEPNGQAVRDWQQAVESVAAQQSVSIDRRNGTPNRLNRSTIEFIRDGSTNGDRHRLLFAAAANLADFNCSFELAWALLSESALDSGLAPLDVRRQIECGLKYRGTV